MTDQDKLYAVVDAVLDLGGLVEQVSTDGAVALSDVPKLTTLLPELLAAAPDLKAVPGALKSMAAADAEALIAHVVSKLALSNQKSEAMADAALKVAASLVALYEAIKA